MLTLLPWAFVALTLAVYYGLYCVQQKLRWIAFNPMLFSVLIMVPLFLYFGVDFAQYNQGGQWLTAMLEPAVVTLGFPLYQQLQTIRKQWFILFVILLIAVFTALLSSVLISYIFRQTPDLAVSLALKSITTPIGLELADLLGGIQALTALSIMFAGLLGALVGPQWLAFIGVTDAKAQGLAIGAGSHVLGTATSAKLSSDHAAYGALSLIVCAFMTSILAP